MEKSVLTAQERIQLLSMAQNAVGFGNPEGEKIVEIAKVLEAYVVGEAAND